MICVFEHGKTVKVHVTFCFYCSSSFVAFHLVQLSRRGRDRLERGRQVASCLAKNENDLRSALRLKSSFEPSFSRNLLRSTANRFNFSASRDAFRETNINTRIRRCNRLDRYVKWLYPTLLENSPNVPQPLRHFS